VGPVASSDVDISDRIVAIHEESQLKFSEALFCFAAACRESLLVDDATTDPRGGTIQHPHCFCFLRTVVWAHRQRSGRRAPPATVQHMLAVLDLFEGDVELAFSFRVRRRAKLSEILWTVKRRTPSLPFAFSSPFGTVFNRPTKQFPLEVP
jgi:hypothetical protein